MDEPEEAADLTMPALYLSRGSQGKASSWQISRHLRFKTESALHRVCAVHRHKAFFAAHALLPLVFLCLQEAGFKEKQLTSHAWKKYLDPSCWPLVPSHPTADQCLNLTTPQNLSTTKQRPNLCEVLRNLQYFPLYQL